MDLASRWVIRKSRSARIGGNGGDHRNAGCLEHRSHAQGVRTPICAENGNSLVLDYLKSGIFTAKGRALIVELKDLKGMSENTATVIQLFYCQLDGREFRP